ncbi:DEAD/DEAH box helicase family protein [Myxococcus sp. AB036A]|uniref:DEAD/DEAH box helicase family protein n=1 Tax=Myxococcus sp. AB036A TaxID=2562793 RepID=UPI00114661DA|nr:DEAD/DEAH box helicase family protein [Myxococcus sp. AB036A]
MTITSPPPEALTLLQEAKEGLADALVNLTVAHCTGEGLDGQVLYGRRPDRALVSGFLLPQYTEAGEDETSDIRIAVIGLDTQVAAQSSGILVAEPSFSVYIRVLPEWAELQDRRYDLKPVPRLKKEWEKRIKEEHTRRYQEKIASHGLSSNDRGLPKEERRERRARRIALHAEAYDETLKELGIHLPSRELKPVAGQTISSPQRANEPATPEDPPEPRASEMDALDAEDPSTVEPAETNPAPIDASGYPLEMLADLEIPMKWRRIAVDLPAFRCELSATDAALEAELVRYKHELHAALHQSVQGWLTTPEGSRNAWRRVRMAPQDWQSEASWNSFLDRLRSQAPDRNILLPDLREIRLTVSRIQDFTAPSRISLRIALENANRELSRAELIHRCPCLFQASLKISLPEAVHRPLSLDRVEPSYRFRAYMTYDAIGLNCGSVSRREGSNIVLESTWAPRWVQPRVVPRQLEIQTQFSKLARHDFPVDTLHRIASEYRQWIAKQEHQLKTEVGRDLSPEQASAEKERLTADVAGWHREAELVDKGVTILVKAKAAFAAEPTSPKATPWRAFVLMNQSFLAREAGNASAGWRLFQLAFVLAHVPCLASRLQEFEEFHSPDEDEDTASLLYFPTGGGKSEAFYGTLVFALFLDRLRGKNRGVTGVVRYPLRLLTLQQAQRLLRLLVHTELVRKKEELGTWPFEIGFWVGSANTPNRVSGIPSAVPFLDDSSHPDDGQLDPEKEPPDEETARAYAEARAAYNKIPVCPLCECPTGLRLKRSNDEAELRAIVVCFNAGCHWNVAHAGPLPTPLPFLFTDDTIYGRAPSVLLGTVDKLAMIGQNPDTIARVLGMFGLARWITHAGHLLTPRKETELRDGPSSHRFPVFPAYDSGEKVFKDPFPSLIIQDEMHLLEESLGTFAGLFETTLEAALRRIAAEAGSQLRVTRSHSRPGAPARMPKVIAATATVSDPRRQLETIYQRRALLFPRPGPDIYSSFFSEPAPPPAKNLDRAALAMQPGRSNSPERTSPWMRLYVSIMTNGSSHTVTTVAVLSAFHLVVTSIWRGLQDVSLQAEASQRILTAVSPDQHGAWRRNALEDLFRRNRFDLLLALLDLHRVAITYVTNKKGGDQVIDALDPQVRREHERAGLNIGSAFPSELISGGVDMSSIQEIMKRAEKRPQVGEPYRDVAAEGELRNVVATSAISHGVDVERFNSMFFAGLPSNIAEYIQASSRVGRTHVGFVVLVPTPQSRRDRYVVETHDIFHRFLERMIDPPAIERWADNALRRAIPSVIQAWAVLEEGAEFLRLREKHVVRPRNIIRYLRAELLKAPDSFRQKLADFVLDAFGFHGRGPQELGKPGHATHYSREIERRLKDFLDAVQRENSEASLADFWRDPRNRFMPPMTSLRDVEEAGVVVGANYEPEHGFVRSEDVKQVMDFIRHQKAKVSEVDEDNITEAV